MTSSIAWLGASERVRLNFDGHPAIARPTCFGVCPSRKSVRIIMSSDTVRFVASIFAIRD